MSELQSLPELLSGLVLDPRTGVLLALLAIAAVIDLRTLRIPNWLTLAGMLSGVAVSALSAPRALDGVGSSVAGLLCGLLLLLPLWLVRVIGAGDVKLMAAVGAFLGPGIFAAALFALVASGALAILVALRGGAIRAFLNNLVFVLTCLLHPGGSLRNAAPKGLATTGKVPFAIAACIGTVAYLLVRRPV